MSKVIQVLEQMARDPNLQNELAIEQLLINTGVTAEQAKAIINKDVISLERQLDVCPDIVCVFVPAENDDDKDETDKEDESKDETKSVINI